MDKTLDIFDDTETLPAVIDPPAGPPVVQRRRSMKRLRREIEAKTAEKLPEMLDQALTRTLELINSKDEKSAAKFITLVFEAAGLRRSGTGMTVNVQQNNNNTAGNGAGFRSFDAIVRRRAQAQQAGQVIDVTPEKG